MEKIIYFSLSEFLAQPTISNNKINEIILSSHAFIPGFPAAAYAAYAAGRGFSGYPSFGLPYPTGNLNNNNLSSSLQQHLTNNLCNNNHLVHTLNNNQHHSIHPLIHSCYPLLHHHHHHPLDHLNIFSSNASATHLPSIRL